MDLGSILETAYFILSRVFALYIVTGFVVMLFLADPLRLVHDALADEGMVDELDVALIHYLLYIPFPAHWCLCRYLDVSERLARDEACAETAAEEESEHV